MTESKQEFIEAIKSDSLAEYELAPGIYLHTDWESDGLFNPCVIVTEGEASGENVERLLEEHMSDVFTFDTFDRGTQQIGDLFYPVGIRFTSDELKEAEGIWC